MKVSSTVTQESPSRYIWADELNWLCWPVITRMYKYLWKISCRW